ncbi:MAG TPA: PIN domain-containing protein [Solirubrobacteraceae bacterium]|nr:PIN domain-containing protein [Solirubrobacteraceae bacterium]
MSEALALLDTSVWARIRDGRLVGSDAERILSRLECGGLASTEPLLLEMRYSARDGREFALLAEELGALPLLELDHAAVDGALQAQAKLAANPRISHRVKPVDLLVAAVADRHGAGVLHYDSDYDLIAKHTDLRFDSVWAAKRGSAG